MRQPSAPSRGVSLREVLPSAEFVGAADIRVASCAGDARSVRPGDLFVLLSDDHPHEAIETAAARGAAALLAPRRIPGHTLPTCLARDSRDAFGRVCQALVGDPSRQLKLIGVAGSPAGSAATHLAASVLAMAGRPTAAFAVHGCHDGFQWTPGETARPSPPAVASWLARAVANGCSHAVLDASDSALAQAGLAGTSLDIAAILRAPLSDPCQSPAAGILDYLAPEGFALLNADDAGCQKVLESWSGPAITFGGEAPAEVSATVVDECLSEQTFLLTAGSETVPVRIHLVGRHNVQNCLLAAAVGMVYGIDPATIARGLEAVPRIPYRLERLECGQEFGVFVDAAGAPAELTAALATLRPLTSGRLVCVLNEAGLATGSRFDMASQARHDGADEVVLGDWRHAVRRTLERGRPGDCVLLAAGDDEAAAAVLDEPTNFDTREFACQCLYEIGGDRVQRRISA